MDSGWFYTVSFINNSFLFDKHPILENNRFSFEIVFERTKLEGKISKGIDKDIQLTIQTIIRKQFELQGELPIYFFLCDMSDKKQTGRSLLFSQWYMNCDIQDWELINYELQDPEDMTFIYYAGLFIHRLHPNYEIIPDLFGKFLEEDASSGKFIRRQ